MAKNQIKIIGLKELVKDLKKLPILKQASILRNANRKAVKKIVIPKLTGANPHGKNKFSRRSKRGKHSNKPFIVHNEKGSKTAVMAGVSGDFFYYRFAEFGTKKRTTKNYKHKGFKRDRFGKRKSIREPRKRLNRGIMPTTRPFINRVLDRSISPLFRYLKTEYDKEIKKGLKRASKK